MTKRIKTFYDDAYTDIGNDLLNLCGDRVEELLQIIQLRMTITRQDSLFGLRDACQMLSARILDAKAQETKDRIAELSEKLGTR